MVKFLLMLLNLEPIILCMDAFVLDNYRGQITHTPETLAKISDSQKLVDRSGANNPMYGKVAAKAMTINVYDNNNVLVRSFTSQVAAAEGLGVSRVTVRNYIKSGKVWNNQYIFRKSST